MNLKYLNLHTGINLKRGRDKILILGLMPGEEARNTTRSFLCLAHGPASDKMNETEVHVGQSLKLNKMKLKLTEQA